MLAKVISCAVVGLEGYIVQVEVDISPGLQDEAVQEARERVRGANRNLGYTFPMKRITVNLANEKAVGPVLTHPLKKIPLR